MNKVNFLELVSNNIDKYGYHVTVVMGETEPRYAYTIGLKSSIGFELVFAGGVQFMKNDLFVIFESIISRFKKSSLQVTEEIEVDEFGKFILNKVDDSWSSLMLLGVKDFYGINEFDALQIVPEKDNFTLDIPKMSEPWNSNIAVWRFLSEPWAYSVPKNSKVVTNLKALKGSKITEVMRWEEDEWEMFAGAGTDVSEGDGRIVELGTILGIDPSLNKALDLHVGKGIWRDDKELIWNKWN